MSTHKYLTIDDITFDPDLVDNMRNWLILHRNETLRGENPGKAFQLSLIIAILGDYKELISDPNERKETS